MTIPITPDAFATFRQRLLDDHDTALSGETEGTISGHGVVAEYHYSEASQTLTVNVKKHPFYMPVSAIEHELRVAATAAA